jgi:hypothetical protein
VTSEVYRAYRAPIRQVQDPRILTRPTQSPKARHPMPVGRRCFFCHGDVRTWVRYDLTGPWMCHTCATESPAQKVERATPLYEVEHGTV